MYTNSLTWESAPEEPNLLVGSGESDWKPAKSQASSIVPSLIPFPLLHIAPQHSKVGYPARYNVSGLLRQRNVAQMKEQIKTSEKELSDEERANLSDAEFKTL